MSAFQAEEVGSIPTTGCVAVADMVMRRIVIPKYVGSNPIGHPMLLQLSWLEHVAVNHGVLGSNPSESAD